MDGRSRPGRTRSSSRGQSETIGVVLILSMTLIGATIALAFGASALDEARLSSQEEGIQHAMTQLDSRAALVALGDSRTQHVPMGSPGGGSYRVDPDAGWINVTHTTYNGTDGADHVIYNESLGALLYENDDVAVAYQGGGVWRAQGDNSTMVSPPEFHYQGATLTLPIIRVEGDASRGGAGVTAKVTTVSSADRIYPSDTDYPDGSGYKNPIREGNVTVTVKSAYWEAWADYFRTRTEGVVSVDPANETASVLLISQGITGDFAMPADGNAIEIRGLDEGHPITEFNVTIRPDDTDEADFSNLQWTLYAEKGAREFEIHLRAGTGGDLAETGDCTEQFVEASIYYSDTNGDPYHGWKNDTAFRTACDDLDGDDTNESYLQADLVGSTPLTLTSLSSDDLTHFSGSGDDLTDPVNFSEHGDTVGWEDPGTEFDADTDSTTIGNLTNHYLSLMGPDVELTVEDRRSDTVNEAASEGDFEQTGGTGKFITFLHITENRVQVELE